MNTITTFTPLGLIVVAFLAIKEAKGTVGLYLAYMLAAIILAMLLLNYQKILPIFVTQTQGG